MQPELRYGVMVALQILVLSVQVRILVSQRKTPESLIFDSGVFSFEILSTIHKKSLEFYCQPASSSRHLHIRKIPATIIVTGTYKQILRFAQNDNASLRMTILSAWASLRRKYLYLLSAWATSTAQATVHPTIGLLPIPRKPIISTWAGTEDEPANCASECIRPMVSVIP